MSNKHNDGMFKNRVIDSKIKLHYLVNTNRIINNMIQFVEKMNPIYPDLVYSSSLNIFMSPSITDCNNIEIIINEPNQLVFITYKMIDDLMVANELYSNCVYYDGWIDELPLSQEIKKQLKASREDLK